MMNQTLVLTRRLRPNLVWPTLLRLLKDDLLFWRQPPLRRWNWLAPLTLIGPIYALYLLCTGRLGLLALFGLMCTTRDLHDNALPVFARIRIRGDEVTRGRLLTERESLKNVAHYQTSREDQPPHAVRFALHKDDWSGCVLLVVDEEDEERLGEFLQARGIVTTKSYFERMSFDEMKAAGRKFQARHAQNLR